MTTSPHANHQIRLRRRPSRPADPRRLGFTTEPVGEPDGAACS